ncbi:MAG: OPT/YSL family transporter [Deltaproteobacteria bacterium]|nr:OPT/YSL family transporter [Deltaproteobacteria bacterium]
MAQAASPTKAPTAVELGFTLRSIITGMAFGGGLSLCNVYLGLKIGWGMNMSITAALLGFGFWAAAGTVARVRPFTVLENNLNQTAASAGAAISSAGLVAPIPALTLLTGTVLTWPQLTVWVLSVGLVGVVAGMGVRKQLIVDGGLAFPGGTATGETLKEMYAKGAEALARVKMLVLGGGFGALSKLGGLVFQPAHLKLPVTLASGKVSTGYTLANLTFSLEPSLLMVATGGIIGLRATLSMLLGSILAWGLLVPHGVETGWITPGPTDPGKGWFTQGVHWLLWPGATLMVVGSLTSFAFSAPAILRGLTGLRGAAPPADDPTDVNRRQFWTALLVVLLASSAAQILLFDIKPWLAVLGVLLSFILAIVAGRVSGETGVTPVGAMGKVTQLTFGVLDPSNVASNLMSANVTGGAASQCGDLLHDLKTGFMLGSWPRHQYVAQAFGVVGGALVGSAAYLVLLPDPKAQLFTDDWAAPAVATWKAVAEVFQQGISAMPTMALEAMAIAAVAGVVLAVLEKTVPKDFRVWVPSPASLGLAFTVQAYTVLAFLIGASVMALGQKFAPSWTARFGIVVCAGVIAGESLIGVGDAFLKMFGG